MNLSSGDKIKCIGMMSGTSLDGMDLVATEFWIRENKWNFKLVRATTVPYPGQWHSALATAHKSSGAELMRLHSKYGSFIGGKIIEFCKQADFQPDLIASHGHTVFHQPDNGFTFQLGHGAQIASVSQVNTISDFRTMDVALGGQGAPLVPIGDELLFGEYDYCLNLGGFANISYKLKDRKAFDICPVNFILNPLASRLGHSYDKDGLIGASGKLIPDLLNQLNSIPFYDLAPPKSLGREWVEKNISPLIDIGSEHIQDILRTIYEHIGLQIGRTLAPGKSVLVTGGGAFNSYLLEKIRHYTQARLILPDSNIIDFKEAIIFAFLGVLRVNERNNCLASVTGARTDNQGGVLYLAHI